MEQNARVAAMNIPASLRVNLARRAGIADAYLYQCLTGRRAMDAAEAVRVEERLAGQLRRWHLRVRDWHRIWPELVGAVGAPAVGQRLDSVPISEAPSQSVAGSSRRLANGGVEVTGECRSLDVSPD